MGIFFSPTKNIKYPVRVQTRWLLLWAELLLAFQEITAEMEYFLKLKQNQTYKPPLIIYRCSALKLWLLPLDVKLCL